MRVAVTGMGWVGSEGAGRFGDTASPTYVAGTPAKVRLKDYFESAEGRSGRLDDYSKLGLAAVALALKDAGLDGWDEKRPAALVSATGYGCLTVDGSYFETALPESGALASPNLFAYTLPNCFVGEAALRFGLTGPTFVVSGASSDGGGLNALAQGVALLVEGEASFVVCGSCELGAPAFLTAREEALGGAVFFVLERAEVPGEGVEGTTATPPLAELSLEGNGLIHEGSGPINDYMGFVSNICKRSNRG